MLNYLLICSVISALTAQNCRLMKFKPTASSYTKQQRNNKGQHNLQNGNYLIAIIL